MKRTAVERVSIFMTVIELNQNNKTEAKTNVHMQDRLLIRLFKFNKFYKKVNNMQNQ